MLNDMSEVSYKTCYAEQLSMALLHVFLPPVQTCGGEDILYIYIYFKYFLDPITNSYLGASWLHSVNNIGQFFPAVLITFVGNAF